MIQTPLPRLRVRLGLVEDEAPYDGVPDHLLVPLQQWARNYLGRVSGVNDDRRVANLMRLGVLCRVTVERDPQYYLQKFVDLAYHPLTSCDPFFEVVDMHLQLYRAGRHDLEELLRDGGSTWRVSEVPPRLERRVADEEYDLYVEAAAEGDDAAEQLRDAWGNVYGRNPNPSYAWNHAIKAVEFLLHPIVSPTNNKATLGSMLADLTNKPDKWTLLLSTSSSQIGEVEVLAGMLRLMWGNPDRHGSGTGYYRNPTPDEAEQIVGLAVLVVSWLRKNALQAATSPSIGP